MSLDSIKESLTRKIGPLQAWVWLVIAGVGIYWYRKKHSSTTATATTSNDESDNYDDGYGSGYTAGEAAVTAGDTTGTGSGGGDTGGGGDTDGNYPSMGMGGGVGAPASTTPSTVTATIPNSILTSLHNISKQLGKLNKGKAKASSKKTKGPVKVKNPAHKTRPRGTATVKSTTHSPHEGTTTKTSTSRTVKGRGGTPVRDRPKTGATTVVARQRPVAATTPAAKAPTKPAAKAPARKVTKKK